MQQELKTIRDGLSGHLKIATIPTALSYVPALTAPFVASNPGVTVSVLSRSSAEILSLLENLEIDVGITYLENEPLGKSHADSALPRNLLSGDARGQRSGCRQANHLARRQPSFTLSFDQGYAEPAHSSTVYWPRSRPTSRRRLKRIPSSRCLPMCRPACGRPSCPKVWQRLLQSIR